MAGTALTRIVALATIMIAPAMLTACAGDLENPERFGLGGGDAGGGGGGQDAGTPPSDEDSGTPGVDGGGGGGLNWADVLAENCAGSGCHGASSPALGLDVVSAGARDRLVNVAATGCADRILVVPGDPDASYLLEKMESSTPECGGRMPLLRGSLSDEQLAAVRTWIAGLSP
ncbi:hypothetical protein [Sandaracinus amylolyticus]|uniref:Tryptophan synthase alpha chain n=1 Tax=Sandaracinus amylolyticus TaxID=927083 RepID=A0A0F6W7N0_9BACT|nr:hypothetical protein [Sandaracinus amylolyticus]AKF09581.1 Tryptophan synthase alpha chain [Sandaracinus amylolyticus]